MVRLVKLPVKEMHMNANWWAMQRMIEFRQAEIARAAQLRSALTRSAPGKEPHTPLRRTFGRLTGRAGRMLLQWGSRLCADQEHADQSSPLHA